MSFIDYPKWRKKKENKIKFLDYSWKAFLASGVAAGVITNLLFILLSYGWIIGGLESLALYAIYSPLAILGAMILKIIHSLVSNYEDEYFCIYQGEKQIDYAERGNPRIKKWEWLIKFEKKQKGTSEYSVKKIEDKEVEK